MEHIVASSASFREEWFPFCSFAHPFSKNRNDDKTIKTELLVLGKDGT